MLFVMLGPELCSESLPHCLSDHGVYNCFNTLPTLNNQCQYSTEPCIQDISMTRSFGLELPHYWLYFILSKIWLLTLSLLWQSVLDSLGQDCIFLPLGSHHSYRIEQYHSLYYALVSPN